eukprot:g2530.t1
MDMSTDPDYPPTSFFTHRQWLDVRNFLWNHGRPYENSSTDKRKHVYEFAKCMSIIQENYVHDPPTRTGYLSMIGTQNAEGFATLATKIRDLNTACSTDALIRSISHPSRTNANGVMALLNNYGNRAVHAHLPNIRPDEKAKVVGLVYKVGTVVKQVFERQYPSGGGGASKEADAAASVAELSEQLRSAQATIAELNRRLAAASTNTASGRRSAPHPPSSATLSRPRTASTPWDIALQAWGGDVSSYPQKADDLFRNHFKILIDQIESLLGKISDAEDAETRACAVRNIAGARSANADVSRFKSELNRARIKLGRRSKAHISNALEASLEGKNRLAGIEKRIQRAFDAKNYDEAERVQNEKDRLVACTRKIDIIATHIMRKLGECKREGWTAGQCKSVGYTAKECLDGGYTFPHTDFQLIRSDSTFTSDATSLRVNGGPGVFKILPEAGPTDSYSACHQNPFSIPSGFQVVSESDPDFELIRTKIIAGYVWGANFATVLSKDDKNTFKNYYHTKNSSPPGKKQSGTHCKKLSDWRFQSTHPNIRLLIRSSSPTQFL